MGEMAVHLSEYNPLWPQAFAEQRDRLAIALGPWLHGTIQHIGSTAIPGMPAKPIIDIAAPVTSLTEAHQAVVALQRTGWRYWPTDPNRSWRLWFLYPRPQARTHHLYLIEHDDPHLRELSAFRDQLRASDTLCAQYADLKHTLAQANRNDRDAYTRAKTDFVANVLQQAGFELAPRSVD